MLPHAESPKKIWPRGGMNHSSPPHFSYTLYQIDFRDFPKRACFAGSNSLPPSLLIRQRRNKKKNFALDAIFQISQMKRILDNFDHAIWWAVILFCAGAMARGAVIPGLDPDINFTGFDPSPNPFTYVPITNNPGNAINTFKPEYVNFFKKYMPVKIGRFMDLNQVNDNSEKTWAGRATTDFGPTGIRWETDIAISNQMRSQVRSDFIPYISRPGLADSDYGFQMGKLWAQQYTGNSIYLADGNEKWSVFGQNLGSQSLTIARQLFPGHSDFDALSLYQGRRLGDLATQFKAGWQSTGRAAPNLTLMVEGFAPTTQYARLQIDQMKADGINLAAFNTHIAIGMYAFGSATDAETLPLGTNAEKRDSTDSWIASTLKAWVEQHRTLAIAEGISAVIDAYEYRAMTKPAPSGSAELASWVAFQLSQENAQGQDFALHTLVPAAGGADAEFMAEGAYGFPLDAPQGQFPLLPYDASYLNNPFASGAFAGYIGAQDFSNTPEPSTLATGLALLAIYGLAGRRRRE